MSDGYSFPPVEPKWAAGHPWLWSALSAAFAGTLFAGWMRFYPGWKPKACLIAGIAIACVCFVVTRRFVGRPRPQPRWAQRISQQISIFDVRRQGGWIYWVLPIGAFGIVTRVVSLGLIEGRLFQVLWGLEIAVFYAFLTIRLRRSIKQVQAEYAKELTAEPQSIPPPPFPGAHFPPTPPPLPLRRDL